MLSKAAAEAAAPIVSAADSTTRVSESSPQAFSRTNRSLLAEFDCSARLRNMRSGGLLVGLHAGRPLAPPPSGLWLRLLGEAGEMQHCINLENIADEFHTESWGSLRSFQQGDLAGDIFVALAPSHPCWFRGLRLRNTSPFTRRVDAFLVQDVGLSAFGAARNCESFVSQYLDHAILQTRLGTALATRQNLAVGGRHPWLLSASLEGAASFGTDGSQFFGTSFRVDGIPAACKAAGLPSVRWQGEFAVHALQSRARELAPGEEVSFVFGSLLVEDHPEATQARDAAYVDLIQAAWREVSLLVRDNEGTRGLSPPTSLADAAPARAVRRPGENLWQQLLPHGSIYREEAEGKLLSAFADRGTHIVDGAKDLLVARAHAHILRAGARDDVTVPHLTNTCFAAGVFGSQVCLGNPNLHRFISVCREPSGTDAVSGMRAWVRTAEGWKRLGVPTLFVMQPDLARWIYETDSFCLEAEVRLSHRGEAVLIDFTFTKGQPLELLVTAEAILGLDETVAPQHVAVTSDGAEAMAHSRIPGNERPHLHACLRTDAHGAQAGGTGLLPFDLACEDAPLLVARVGPTPHSSFALGVSLNSANEARERATRKETAMRDWPALSLAVAENDDAAALDTMLPWLMHNAWVHYASPHGLEQFSGAAWGVRDVCQGPVEMFLALDRPGLVRDILMRVYAAQYLDTGDWPQWFMFDDYPQLAQRHAHGDVAIWPLKALCDYLEHTADFSILDESIDYRRPEDNLPAKNPGSLREHIGAQLDLLEKRSLPGTALPAYGEGDWDDSLQPADTALRETMCSVWTAALLTQTLRRFAEACRRGGESRLAQRCESRARALEADMRRLAMPGGVLAGFMLHRDGVWQPLLHPEDRLTGRRLRLLPITRSIIAGLLAPDEVHRHFALLEEFLCFPDGVRLMDRPADYHGGPEKFFCRAESAANFGREIGLMYTHAHLRYIEACAVLGDADRAWRAVGQVMAPGLTGRVPNALPRQANVYFSSSDAVFADRAEAQARFSSVRTGEVPVASGWRLYSSGPGIMVGLAVRCLAGFQPHFDKIRIAPLLPPRSRSLRAEFPFEGQTLRWHVRKDAGSAPRLTVNGTSLPLKAGRFSPYREAYEVCRANFVAALRQGLNEIELVMTS